MCARARRGFKTRKPLSFLALLHIAGGSRLNRDDDLRIRPGRVRSRGDQNARSFVAKALAAAERAGGRAPRTPSSSRASTFGRGRSASLRAGHRQSPRSRICIVKARVVRHGARAAPLGPHLKYLRREGVTRDGAPGRLFDARQKGVDAAEFAERCDGDRRHFRFIVSPEDGPEMADLKAFTRDLMGQAAKDLGTGLDWVAVEHWDTQHPHVHVLVRGRADDGRVVGQFEYKAGIWSYKTDCHLRGGFLASLVAFRRSWRFKGSFAELGVRDWCSSGVCDIWRFRDSCI